MQTTQTRPDQTRPVHDRWTRTGLVCVALAAGVMGFAAWTGLGELVGITQTATLPGLDWTVRLSWLLQISIEGYALIAIRVWWADQSASDQTKRYAARQAVGAIVTSFLGQALFHVAQQYDWTAGSWWWTAIVAVSGLPAVMLGLSIDLLVRLQRDQQTAAVSVQTSPAAADQSIGTDLAAEPAASAARVEPAVPALEAARGASPDQSTMAVQSSSPDQSTPVADLIAARRRQSTGRQSSPRRAGRDYEAIWLRVLADYQTAELPSKRGLMAQYEITNADKGQELLTRLREHRATSDTPDVVAANGAGRPNQEG